jgi:ATP-dependent helicase HrpB
MVPLPIDSFLPEITSRLREARALVLVAEPGAGKTTRVPPAILRANVLGREHPNVVMLQPRRVAARAAAERVADENGWELGREVGYHVRFERRIGPQTRLRVLTEGILTRQLLDDPFLEGVGAVLLDEFHERSLYTDVTIALLREVRQTVREDLMLVVMSATLDAGPVAAFLGNCPIVRVPGRTFPVEVAYSLPSGERLPERVAAAVGEVVERGTGDSPVSPTLEKKSHGRVARATPAHNDVLVFLPGAEEIRRTAQQLERLAERNDLLVLPLHGSLPADEQQRALRPAKQRKVILATNIAETSLTIDGVGTVVDSGLARVAGYDPQRGLDRLDLKRISKASATQRAGRAGRTGPGRCVRLWTQREEQAMADYELPEVRRVDLAGTVLALHAWGKPDPRQFGWFEAPPEQTLAAAERLLAMLGALDKEDGGAITPVGRAMVGLPVHPRLARLLLAAAGWGRLAQGAAVAALLSEKDIVVPSFEARRAGPRTQGDSDLAHRLELLAEAERARFAPTLYDRGTDPAAARQVAKTRDELLRVTRHLGSTSPASPASAGSDDEALLKFALLAYPDRVCRRRESDPSAGVMVGGGGVRLAPESVVRAGEYFVAADARVDDRSATREALVRVAAAVHMQWLEELFSQSIRTERFAAYDPNRRRAVGRMRVLYRDLVLREVTTGEVDPAAAEAALREALLPKAQDIVGEDEQIGPLMWRLSFLQHALPGHLGPKNGWSSLDKTELVAEACIGAVTLEDVKANLRHVAEARLTHEVRRLLDEHAPEALTVPSGNRIRLDWSAAGVEPLRGPVLSVRLQELFGWTDTPRVAGGRVPVRLELLGPNYRPVQVTEDLRNFWANTYFQVRKDLRARYPKHSWPEDPLSAKPEAKGGRRR